MTEILADMTPTRVLEAASAETLLDTIVRLTHAIDHAPHPDRKTHLREQRALVRAEVIRRIPVAS